MLLGLKQADDFDDFDDEAYKLDKSTMQIQFLTERGKMKSMQDVFTNELGVVTHAVGHIFVTNENEHIEWGEDQEFVIGMLWRHMYYRKIIPEKIIDGEDDIDIMPIVDRHY